MTRRWALWAGIAIVLEVAYAPGSFAEPKAPRRCYAIRVDAADTAGSRSPGRSRGRQESVFSAGESKDLEIGISVSDAAATLPVRVKLFTPRGKLYQVLDAAAELSSDDGNRRSRRRTRALAARFPVAGTQVTSYALFGEWRAEVYLDGSEAPCAQPLEFVIEP
jgi:hypothetical protein